MKHSKRENYDIFALDSGDKSWVNKLGTLLINQRIR